MNKKVVSIIAVAVLLTGCGKGSSGGSGEAGSSEASSNEQSSTVSGRSALSASRSGSITVDANAFDFLMQALQGLRFKTVSGNEMNRQVGTVLGVWSGNGLTTEQMHEELVKQIYVLGAGVEDKPEALEKAKADKNGDAYKFVNQVLNDPDNPASTIKTKTMDEVRAYVLAEGANEAFGPTFGWSTSGFNAERMKAAEKESYINIKAVEHVFNAALDRIATLSPNLPRSEMMREAQKAMLAEIPRIEDFYKKAGQEYDASPFSACAVSGCAPVEYQLGSEHVVRGRSGGMLQRNGVTVLGDGKIDGQTIVLHMTRDNKATIERSGSQGSTSSTNSASNADGAVSAP